MQSMYLIFRLALRELRNNFQYFNILFLCLLLGVAAFSSVQSLSRGIKDTLLHDGRYILGGDIALRTVYSPISDDKMMFLRKLGPVSVMMETRAMVRREDGTKSMLVDLKAIDPFYPLYGKVDFVDGYDKPIMFQVDSGKWRVATPQDIVLPENMEAFEAGQSLWGVAVEKKVLQRLNLHIGDILKLGKQNFRIRGIINHEPDRLSSSKFSVSPRIMMSYYTIEDAGLMQNGRQLYYDHRIVMPHIRTIEGLEKAKDRIVKSYPKANWQGRTFLDAAPQIRKTVDSLNVFLTLISLASLLIGGVGIANSVTAYLQGKYNVIASLKCIGGSHKIIFWLYFLQILLVSIPAILIGVILGAVIPKLIAPLLTDSLSLSNQVGIYPDILIISALFGFFILCLFIIWPVAKACQIRTADLFRSKVTNISGRPSIRYIIAIFIVIEVLALLLFLTIKDSIILIYFLGFTITLLAIFFLLSNIVQFLARIYRSNKNPSLRMALANLYRPNNSTTAILISMGFAMSIMLMIAMTESNFKITLKQNFNNSTPSFHFIDIKISDINSFRKTVSIFPTTHDLNLTLSDESSRYEGTVKLSKNLEIKLQNQLAEEFPNITIIRMHEILGDVERLTNMAGQAIKLGALLTIIMALLVLQGSILSGQRQHLYNAVILKILGVSKKRLGLVFLIEYGVLSAVVVIISAILGSALSYGIYNQVLQMPWIFDIWALLKISFICVVLTLIVGYLNIRRVLSYKVTTFLRHE